MSSLTGKRHHVVLLSVHLLTLSLPLAAELPATPAATPTTVVAPPAATQAPVATATPGDIKPTAQPATASATLTITPTRFIPSSTPTARPEQKPPDPTAQPAQPTIQPTGPPPMEPDIIQTLEDVIPKAVENLIRTPNSPLIRPYLTDNVYPETSLPVRFSVGLVIMGFVFITHGLFLLTTV